MKTSTIENLAAQTDRHYSHASFNSLYATPPDGVFPQAIAEANALTISTYWACITLISDDLAAVPWRCHRKVTERRTEIDTDSNVDWLLNKQPNEEQTAFIFRQTQMSRVLARGNAFAEIERDLSGRPIWLWPIENERVQLERVNGTLYYRVTNFNRQDTYVPIKDMLHFRGMGDGLLGYSVLEAASRMLNTSLGLDRYSAETADVKKQVQVGGILKTKKVLNEASLKRLEKDFLAKHMNKPGSIPILEDDMEFEPIKLYSPHDIQLIESQKYNAASICRFFKVPLHKVGLLDKETNKNTETHSIEYVTQCLVPWTARLEQEADIKMLGRIRMTNYFTRHRLVDLIRGDMESRARYYKEMFSMGVFSPNDIAYQEDYNPVPFGDSRFVQAQLNTLERATKGEPVSVNGHNPAARQTETGSNRQTEQGQEFSVSEELRECISKSVKRLAHRMHQAKLNYGNNQSRMLEYLRDLRNDHRDYYSKRVSPHLSKLNSRCSDVIVQCEFSQHWETCLENMNSIDPKAETALSVANLWDTRYTEDQVSSIISRAKIAHTIYGVS